MNKKRNIVLLCGANPFKGPGIIALDLYKKFSLDGNTVKIISNQQFNSNNKDIISIANHSLQWKIFRHLTWYNIRKRVAYLSEKSFQKYVMVSVDKPELTLSVKEILDQTGFPVDIFIYMFSHNFLWPNILEQLYRETNAPILFWMMDSAAMTGGCHFTWDCNGYRDHCGNCPALNSKKSNDVTRKNMIVKESIFKKIDLYPVYCTERQKQMLLESSLFKETKNFNVPIPVDKNYFKPIENNFNRKKYSLPEDKKLIFFAAQNLDDERKGIKLLFDAFEYLSRSMVNAEKDKIVLVIAGKKLESISSKLPFKQHYLGYVTQFDFSNILALVDLFVCPSIEDTGPMMINQSLMSGTSVVSFDMGIASEVVKTGVTGYLAKVGDVRDLARGMNFVLNLNDLEKHQISKNSRDIAIEKFSVEKVSEQFYSIFDSIY
ncbi:MAG: glycosyltransferase [Bacteroidota bacterium]|jgi:glycosyltransferase involved in cell wall biosynthesis